LITFTCFAYQSNSDRELARTQDYIAATQQKGAAKIAALKAYIKKFPETTSKWTRLAYYSLTIEYFQSKNYKEAITQGEKRLGMGDFGGGEEARLALVMAESYSQLTPANKNKALSYTNKSISLAKAANDKNVLNAAQKLKDQLSGPKVVKKKLPPEKQIKRHYSLEEYSEAISFYGTLGSADKNNPEIRKIYANSLFKDGKLDSAIREFKTLHSTDRKGNFAYNLGKIYSQKARRNKNLYDTSVNYFIEAGYLFKKEGNSTNQKAAFGKAEYDLFEKYGYNAKVKELEREVNKSRSKAQQNEALLKKKKRELRKAIRDKDRYELENDMEAPPNMYDAIRKLEKEITMLESGADANTSNKAEQLEAEKARIQKELETLKAKIKKELEL
jgi:hypothetical protein